jgi:hypothetical protein
VEAISASIAQSNATDVVQHAAGLRRVAQAMHDLEDYLGGEPNAQIVLDALKNSVPAALKTYRRHLVAILEGYRNQRVGPDQDVVFAVNIYATACAQIVSDELRNRATQWNPEIGGMPEGIGQYAILAAFVTHPEPLVQAAYKAGILAFELHLITGR